ncbi:hypothetical protein [Mycobacterium avium]|uniref:hypothetical protein n=1 Tax=Mycobacterium avium TaxID=1764 RepID=UPI0007A06D5B|nr:hypothetical protein [Mycobacterium avium]
MSYTEIPTDLLVELTNLLPNLGYRFEQADYSSDVALTISRGQMSRLMPLIKWLDYIEAVWHNNEDEDLP